MWNFNVPDWKVVFFFSSREKKGFKTLHREQNVAVTLKITHLISLLHCSNFNKLYCTLFLYSNPQKKKIHLLSKQHDGLYVSTH